MIEIETIRVVPRSNQAHTISTFKSDLEVLVPPEFVNSVIYLTYLLSFLVSMCIVPVEMQLNMAYIQPLLQNLLIILFLF